ncbi:sugar-binding transcriptional regulator [Acuticoccus sp. MNP-M23]|uniref:sugar-binding transcriptional regulator n=1 Tax=Acuticoccus sp. MNP-M23 TaxID=3072793 RepID=UPI0028152A3A|nr:sugar-binding transcriptional regulator [Acuticoccus sp. MNP-M23]WMS43970.1 sugar-binding transcriptional regulator [Acuticoccus sp. MNP-M23]
MSELSDIQLMTRAAWLYYVAGLNQEAAAGRMGLSRARVNRLLQQARESGLVSITINANDIGLLPVEEAIRAAFGLDFCIATPAYGLSDVERASNPQLGALPIRAVGAAAARYLRETLNARPDAVVGTGWGRTLAQMSKQMAGISAPKARFVSLMGSLTANSAFNPFEVVQSLAQATGGDGFFLPVPFIADTPQDRDTLLAQQTVAKALELARYTDIAMISVGELTETSLLRRQDMISQQELTALRDAGAVGDTNGIFFDAKGWPVPHELNHRTIAVGFEDLRRATTVVLAAGAEKIDATRAILASGVARGIIVDGDTACLLAEAVAPGSARDAMAQAKP